MTTTIDFNTLGAGTVVGNQFNAEGVTISASGGSGQAMIFNTANPTGGDHDLATTNLGKVLIISEDGNSSDPDDNAGGGTFSFAFDTAAMVQSLTFLDVEETATITLYDAHGAVIDTIHVGATGNNGQVVVPINVAGVASMDVALAGSGAIDDLVFDASPLEESGPDYIVEGTSGDDLIDAGYDQDPEGDMIDALDDGGSPASNDDSVRAGAGDDTVYAGAGNDTVSGGSGNDFLLGDDDNAQAGDDLLLGEDGDDTLCGLDGDDTLDGGAGDDLLEGMEGDDLLLGGSGNDLAYGDNGNDTIFGDAGGQDDGSVREVFQWDLSPSTGAPNFSQDTGNVTVSFSEINGGASDDIASNTQNVAGIDTGTLTADSTSSLDSETGGQGNSDTYVLGFSDAVENVSFRVNDIDGDGVVKIEAFDAAGNPIEVQLAGGSNITLLDTDGVAGNDTADSNGGYMADTAPEYSLLVTIPGPVSEIRILHSQDGSDNSGINVTDVFFDVPNVNPSEGDGDDTLVGGAGDDLIYGNGGDDSINGNSGDDTLFGDDPAAGTPVSGNLIFNGSFEITSGMDTTGYGFRGDGNAPGWTDANGNEIDFHNDGRGGVNPTDGDNWLDLESSPGNARVGQTVDGVQDGETYKLSFDAGDKSDEPQSGAGENLIEVYWGGELIAVVDPEAGQMDEYTFNVTGGSGDGTNKLEFVGLGAEDNFGASIDNVSLVQLAGEPGEGGDDTINGGTGADVIDGQEGDDDISGGQGDDLLTGGEGADSISGGDDSDTILGGNDGDVVDGGTGSTAAGDVDDMDVLDLTGSGPFQVVNETPDADGNSTSGTIEFLDGTGVVTGSMTFTEIEEIIGDRVNQGPDAVDDAVPLDEDGTATFNPTGNDTDPDGDTLTVTDISDPANGTLTDNGDGTYTYEPNDDFNGTDSVTYTISDGNGGTDTATVTFDVAPVNDDPVADDDSGSGDEDMDITGNVLGNDTDVDGDTLTVISNTDPANGTVTIDANGDYTYTPNDDFNGTDSFTYTVSDGNGGTDTATVNLTVNSVNDAPDAVNDANSTPEDEAVSIDVLGNDTDPDGDALTITGASVPADQGTVEIVGGELLFTPAENFNGPATISYSISDGNGGTDTAEVTVNVTPVNDDPVAVDDSASTMEDEAVVVDLLGNDQDVDGDTLTLLTATVDPSEGTLVDNGDGTVTFTPAENFNGPATISYTVSDGNGGTDEGQAVISVGAVNDGPTAVDDTATTPEDEAVTIDVVGNDTDPDGDVLTIVGATVPAEQGTVEIVGNELLFTPAENFNGPATISYTVTDGNGGTDTGTVNVDVTPVNDDPVALDDVDTTDEDEAVIVDLIGNDTDVDGDTLTLVSATVDPSEGTLVDNGDGTVTFTPALNFNGPATITYTVSDGNGGTDEGQAIVSVGAINDGPVAVDDSDTTPEDTPITVDVVGNDTDADGDTLTLISAVVPAEQGTTEIVGNEVVFTPAENFNGPATITYTIADGNGGTDVGELTVNVTPVNDDPDAVDDSDSTDFETPVTIDLLANDTDVDGDTLTIASVDVPVSEGTLSQISEGVYEFTPADGFEGTATVTYTVSDGQGGTDSAVHTIEVGADPTPPDGVVDGEEDGEDMQPGYDDGGQATDNGGDIIDGPDGDDDVINGNGGDDTINAGQGSDTVSGGTGDDSIIGGASDDGDDLSGDEGDDTIQGGGGEDTIDGGIGDDVLEGGTGDDTITGGDGNDSVEGGEGDDVIDTSGTDPATDRDTPNIPPFITGGPGDVDPDDDKDTVNGGAGDDTITTGDDADVITGGMGNDVIDGGIDDDTIDGGADDDLIIGGEGSDSILGGGGNDTIYGGLDSTAPDVLNVADDGFNSPIGLDPVLDNGDDFIDGGAGDDLIFGADDNDTILGGTGNDTIDGGVDDDSISGGAGDDSLLGDHGDDFIEGNFGNDTLEGGRGNDTLEGNGDDDLILGGAGDSIIGGGDSDTIVIEQDEVDSDGENDTAIFVDGSGNGDDRDTLDLTDYVAHRNLVETPDGDGNSTSGSVEVQNDDLEWVEVTFAEIETLLLPPQAPDLVVDGEEFGEVMNPLYDDADGPTDGGGDIIDGPDGDDDSIRGNGGDDTINAGEGDDTVDGGADNDSILGGNGDDIIEGGEGDDTVRGEVGDDTVSGGDGNDSVTGGMGDDVLDGGDGDDSLTGGSGDDTIDGGIGNDSITGSTGNDSITDLDGDNLINSDNPGSFNPDLGTPIPLPGGGFVVVAPDADPDDNKDTITTGAGDDTINAGDDADVIDAGDGDNVVDGGTDNDTITTGSGDDSIIGGEGDDLINSGDGNDTIEGGVNDPAANFIDEPNAGFAPDPILNNGDDTINAGGGDDVVFGEDDNDVIDGGTGNDTLDGGIDDDTILGGEGDDVIIGGQGADSLDGGTGDDVFNVGTFTDPNGTGDYQEGVGDKIVGGEDADDNDIDTLDLTGGGSLKVVFDDSVDPTGTPGESGTVIYYTDDTQTEESGRLEFKEIENVIPCFTPGAMIATPRGEVPVETLRAGDKVITRDNGIQEICWTGNRTLNRAELSEGEGMKPILIKAGSLGRNLPERDMLVSPQHRVLVTGEQPQLYFEESEVLVAAKHLVGKTGVSIMDTMRTTYIHFMFESHEVVLSDGAWTESFQPGDQTMGSMGEATREEIFALFPELATAQGLTDYAAARRTLKAHEAKLLRN